MSKMASYPLRALVLITAFLLAGNSVNAQLAPAFNGALDNVLNLNPAAAGSYESAAISAWYRQQWTGIQGGPATLHLAAHAPLGNENYGLGGEIGLERLGPVERLMVRASYAYRVTQNWGTISAGINAGLWSLRTSAEGLDGVLSGDPAFADVAESSMDWEAGLGLMWNDREWMVGAALHDLADLRQWYGSAAWLKPINEQLDIRTSVLGRGASVSPAQVDLGLHFFFLDAFRLGGRWRTNNAWTLDAEYRFVTQTTYGFAEFGIGYGFENAPPEIRSVSSSSHEIYLIYRFGKDRSKVVNPRFF